MTEIPNVTLIFEKMYIYIYSPLVMTKWVSEEIRNNYNPIETISIKLIHYM